MPNPIELTLPANDAALREEILRELAPYADVHEPPPTFGLNEVKLIIEIIGGSIGMLASTAALAKFVLDLKDRRKLQQAESPIQIARLGEPGVPLAEADEETVRKIIGVAEK